MTGILLGRPRCSALPAPSDLLLPVRTLSRQAIQGAAPSTDAALAAPGPRRAAEVQALHPEAAPLPPQLRIPPGQALLSWPSQSALLGHCLASTYVLLHHSEIKRARHHGGCDTPSTVSLLGTQQGQRPQHSIRSVRGGNLKDLAANLLPVQRASESCNLKGCILLASKGGGGLQKPGCKQQHRETGLWTTRIQVLIGSTNEISMRERFFKTNTSHA